MFKFKIVWMSWLLSIASACSTRKGSVTAYTVRFLPVWNPLMEVMITICTLPNVLTQFIHSFFKPGPNVIIKNNVKIMDKDQNNYYTTHLSDIHLAPSLCSVKRHNIYKETEKMKCELTYPQTSASESQVDSFWSVCNMTATSSIYTIMYPTSTLKKWVINTYVAYKNGFNIEEIIRGVNKYS